MTPDVAVTFTVVEHASLDLLPGEEWIYLRHEPSATWASGHGAERGLASIADVPRIVLTTRLSASARQCFDLSLSVDAHAASMSRSGERILAGVESGVMGLGDSVTWRARHFGIPFTMTSQITEYDAPHRFVDEQVTGPFRRWWHEHAFAESDGMTDTVEFASPLGPLGKLVDATVLTRYMTRLLTFRNLWLVDALS